MHQFSIFRWLSPMVIRFGAMAGLPPLPIRVLDEFPRAMRRFPGHCTPEARPFLSIRRSVSHTRTCPIDEPCRIDFQCFADKTRRYVYLGDEMGADGIATTTVGESRRQPRVVRRKRYGERYEASDSELVADRDRARGLTRRCNCTDPHERCERRESLAELLGTAGEACEIEPRFGETTATICTSGQTSARTWTVNLDVCRVAIGENCQF